MKKNFIFMVIAGMLVLAGCGGTTETSQSNMGTTMTDVWDEATKLMTGTMLLETTNTPLSTEQESSLLLLWKGYNAVMTSSTTSDTEIDALVKQIKGVFTDEQTAAIEAMGLTSETYADKLAEVDVQVGMPAGFGNSDSETSGTPQFPMDGQMPPDGQMPSFGQMSSGNSQRTGGGGQMPSGGGMPGGGMMPGGMNFGGDASITGDTGTSTLSMQATQQASMGFSERSVNRMVLMAVIQYLNQAVNQ